MNREEILKKLPRTIPKESASVSMNETLINLLRENRAEKVWGKRGREKKIPSGAVVSEETPQEEQQPGPSWQINNLAEPSNDESSDEEEHNGTNCKICNIPWVERRTDGEMWRLSSMRYMQ